MGRWSPRTDQFDAVAATGRQRLLLLAVWVVVTGALLAVAAGGVWSVVATWSSALQSRTLPGEGSTGRTAEVRE